MVRLGHDPAASWVRETPQGVQGSLMGGVIDGIDHIRKLEVCSHKGKFIQNLYTVYLKRKANKNVVLSTIQPLNRILMSINMHKLSYSKRNVRKSLKQVP